MDTSESLEMLHSDTLKNREGTGDALLTSIIKWDSEAFVPFLSLFVVVHVTNDMAEGSSKGGPVRWKPVQLETLLPSFQRPAHALHS